MASNNFLYNSWKDAGPMPVMTAPGAIAPPKAWYESDAFLEGVGSSAGKFFDYLKEPTETGRRVEGALIGRADTAFDKAKSYYSNSANITKDYLPSELARQKKAAFDLKEGSTLSSRLAAISSEENKNKILAQGEQEYISRINDIPSYRKQFLRDHREINPHFGYSIAEAPLEMGKLPSGFVWSGDSGVQKEKEPLPEGTNWTNSAWWKAKF